MPGSAMHVCQDHCEEVPVIPEFSLCRFRTAGNSAHLGLAMGGQLYDLATAQCGLYESMEAWLKAASGRAAQAIAMLKRIPTIIGPLCAAEALLDPQSGLTLLSPLDTQEVWACGVTYEMSRAARMRESQEPTIYERVYESPRPEVFLKATPHRVVGTGEAVAIRADSKWDVPEAELALVLTPQLEIVGYTIGNDMSSRDIEGENPLYLPQAKIYDRCCALGPCVRLATEDLNPLKLAVKCTIHRGGQPAWTGETNTAKIHRPLKELIRYIGRCNSFPTGLFVVTGTGTVPPDTFTLAEGDVVEMTFEGLGTLTNPVIKLAVD